MPYSLTPLAPGGLVAWLDSSDASMITCYPITSGGWPIPGVSRISAVRDKGSFGGVYGATSVYSMPRYNGSFCPLYFDG